MAVISTQLIDKYQLHENDWRGIVEATFSDGRTIRLALKNNTDDFSAVVASAGPALQEQMRLLDASKAYVAGVVTDFGEATRQDILRIYATKSMKRYRNKNYRDAYKIMKKFMPTLISLGLTPAQYAALLDTTIDNVQSLNQAWTTLNSHAALLEA